MLGQLKSMNSPQTHRGTEKCLFALRALVASLCLCASVVNFAFAVTVDPQLADPKLEARAKDISRELRCLVCQNQSIEDSGAPLARDLRIIVRERILAGDNDAQVKDYVVARYGDWVLLRPPFNARTLLLWIGPVVLLVTAVAGLGLYYRRTRKQFATATVAPLSGEEKRRLDDLLKGTGA
jgi:cytochrome c-type biogenesis protein CcmH